ncbi:hypothetical protein MUK42_21335 [Musa troglodytarum]|uniref:Uncharacterized protein n=1 Tax=Musa troglodytarum TaxID=320322 RepID=A0A9E7LFP7_9LILI|nr:hypothetical protein MUK42_21335 [Musa troglodytarum]
MHAEPCSETEVTPALAMSGTWPLRKLYHPSCFLHDSQLKPCKMQELSGSNNKQSSSKSPYSYDHLKEDVRATVAASSPRLNSSDEMGRIGKVGRVLAIECFHGCGAPMVIRSEDKGGRQPQRLKWMDAACFIAFQDLSVEG